MHVLVPFFILTFGRQVVYSGFDSSHLENVHLDKPWSHCVFINNHLVHFMIFLYEIFGIGHWHGECYSLQQKSQLQVAGFRFSWIARLTYAIPS